MFLSIFVIAMVIILFINNRFLSKQALILIKFEKNKLMQIYKNDIKSTKGIFSSIFDLLLIIMSTMANICMIVIFCYLIYYFIINHNDLQSYNLSTAIICMDTIFAVFLNIILKIRLKGKV